MSATDTSDNDLIIDDDEDLPSAQAREPEPDPWQILIVDDDVDVHVVTKFALSNASFQGRRLGFLHAYSGKEALTVLQEHPGVALVLLDVIMETDDAGLRVARQIRSDLHNELARIVLRTGQPGQALEHAIIVDYDINDFWCKADLTTRKLFTTVIASLRAYSGLAAAAAARAALNARLAKIEHLQAIVDEHALVASFDRQGRLTDVNDKLLAFTGHKREQLLGRDLRALDREAWSAPTAAAIRQALAGDGHWSGPLAVALPAAHTLACTVRAFSNEQGQFVEYVAIATIV
jgi:CheY-like chemotaxis protein